MSDAIFWRIVWKEYRAQRGFWLGVAGFAAVAWVLVLASVDRAQDRTLLLYGVAFVLPAFYALGCGAVLFAGEHEDGTFHLLRQLPLSPVKILSAKLGFGVVSTAALFVVLTVAAWMLAGFRVPNQTAFSTVLTWPSLTLEFLAWGLFYSLLLARPLNAICLAAVTAMLIRIVWPYGLLMLPVVLIADAWLAARWLADRRGGWSAGWAPLARSADLATLAAIRERAPAGSRTFRKLVWQEWRHALLLAAWFIGGGLLLVALSGLVQRQLDFNLALLVIAGTPVLMGLWVFRGEQQLRHYRYLSDRGIPAQTVWLSKQVVWLSLAVIATSLFIAVDHLAQGAWYRSWYGWGRLRTESFITIFRSTAHLHQDTFTVLALLLLSSYGIGQCLSLLLRRTVTAAFVSVVLVATLAGWFAVTFALGVPVLFSLALVPVAMMAATYVRTGDWMLERTDWRAWLKVGVTMAAPLVVLLVGVMCYRAFEVPRVALSFDHDTIVRLMGFDESKQVIHARTAALHDHLAASIRPFAEAKRAPGDDDRATERVWELGWSFATEEQASWLDEHEQLVPSIENLAFHPISRMRDLRRVSYGTYTTQTEHQMADVLMLSARKLEAEGALDVALKRWLRTLQLANALAKLGRANAEWMMGYTIRQRALERLPLWAAAPGQTPQGIRDAIAKIQAEASRFPALADAIKVDHVLLKHAIVEYDAPTWDDVRLSDLNGTLLASAAFRRAPWEVARALRCLDHLTSTKLNHVSTVQTSVATNQNLVRSAIMREDDRGKDAMNRWIFTTPALNYTTYFHPDILTTLVVQPQMQLRAALLQLALAAWRLEHGHLPDSLRELEGTPIPGATLDPWTGREFEYHPAGVPDPLRFSNRTIFPEEPFLWSVGPKDARIVAADGRFDGQPRLAVVDAGRRWFQRTGADPDQAPIEVWAFPIPPQTLPAPEPENEE